MSLTSLILTASEGASSEPAVNPYVVGAISLGILLIALIIVMAIGGGREHS